MAPTHAAIAVAGTTLFLGSPTELSIALALLGSQLPDIDTSKSFIGRVFYPVARYFEERYPHRTITHSLLATVAVAVVSAPLLFYTKPLTWLALPLAHFLSCLSDTFTKQGVALFWPSPVWAVYGRNPNLRLRTGGRAEYWVLIFFFLLSLWLINLHQAGGLLLNFNRLLGIKEGVFHFYNRHGHEHHIWVEITGNKVSDRSPVNSRFFLIAQEGEELIVQDRTGVYKTGENLSIDRITADTGRAGKIIEQSMVLKEDDLIYSLEWLRRTYPSGAIYLNGSIEVDEPEEILLAIPPGQYQTITKLDNAVTLKHCPLETAIAILKDQYAYGVLHLKIFVPKPEL